MEVTGLKTRVELEFKILCETVARLQKDVDSIWDRISHFRSDK